ncbi:MAG: archaeosortase/exosortase family protein [Ferruginibacter sp.]
MLKNKNFTAYLVKFLFFFCLLYFGTLLWIGITTPGGVYFSFADKYFDYISFLRKSIIGGARFFLSAMNYDTVMEGEYNVRLKNGYGIHMVYSCLGYGIMSFWAAFVIANTGSVKKKISWVVAGFIIIWILNVLRIALLILARNNKTTIFNGISHHTFFNIVAYLFVFLMMYLFDRSLKNHNSNNVL